MLIARSETHFFTDPRYGLEAAEKIAGKVHVARIPLLSAAAAVVKRKKWKKIGFESGWLNYRDFWEDFQRRPAARVLALPALAHRWRDKSLQSVPRRSR